MFFLLEILHVLLMKIFLNLSDIKQPFAIANAYKLRSRVIVILDWLYEPMTKLRLLFFSNIS
jgi:hypothetical protein